MLDQEPLFLLFVETVLWNLWTVRERFNWLYTWQVMVVTIDQLIVMLMIATSSRSSMSFACLGGIWTRQSTRRTFMTGKMTFSFDGSFQNSPSKWSARQVVAWSDLHSDMGLASCQSGSTSFCDPFGSQLTTSQWALQTLQYTTIQVRCLDPAKTSFAQDFQTHFKTDLGNGFAKSKIVFACLGGSSLRPSSRKDTLLHVCHSSSTFERGVQVLHTFMLLHGYRKVLSVGQCLFWQARTWHTCANFQLRRCCWILGRFFCEPNHVFQRFRVLKMGWATWLGVCRSVYWSHHFRLGNIWVRWFFRACMVGTRIQWQSKCTEDTVLLLAGDVASSLEVSGWL